MCSVLWIIRYCVELIVYIYYVYLILNVGRFMIVYIVGVHTYWFFAMIDPHTAIPMYYNAHMFTFLIN